MRFWFENYGFWYPSCIPVLQTVHIIFCKKKYALPMHNEDTIYIRNEYSTWDFSLELGKEWVQVSAKPLAIHSATWNNFMLKCHSLSKVRTKWKQMSSVMVSKVSPVSRFRCISYWLLSWTQCRCSWWLRRVRSSSKVSQLWLRLMGFNNILVHENYW